MNRKQFAKQCLLSLLLCLPVLTGCGGGVQPGVGGLWGGSGTGASSGPQGKVVFVNTDSGRYQLYLASADGKNIARLTNGNWHDYRPTFSPDGTRIIFASTREQSTGQLYVMNSDGTTVSRLTNGAWSDSGPAFSADGKKLVFESDRDTHSVAQLYLLDLETGAVTRLTRSETQRDLNPVFAPDGKSVVFARGEAESAQLFRINTDGTGLTALTSGTGSNKNPTFSPDGKKIVFESSRSGSYQLWQMNRDGGEVKRLTNNSFQDYSPAFSPDGKYLIFMSSRTEGFQLFRIKSDGSEETLLARIAGNSSDPRWGKP